MTTCSCKYPIREGDQNTFFAFFVPMNVLRRLFTHVCSLDAYLLLLFQDKSGNQQQTVYWWKKENDREDYLRLLNAVFVGYYEKPYPLERPKYSFGKDQAQVSMDG
jgi:hypothetical protein